MQPFKLFCNVFCKSTEWYICFTKLYTVMIVASHQIWHNGGVTIYFWIFTMITNASTLLESSFTIYPFLTPRIANALSFILIRYCILLIIHNEKHLHFSWITSQLHKFLVNFYMCILWKLVKTDNREHFFRNKEKIYVEQQKFFIVNNKQYTVLKIFDHHLNYKCKFTIITIKTICDHFWKPIWS